MLIKISTFNVVRYIFLYICGMNLKLNIMTEEQYKRIQRLKELNDKGDNLNILYIVIIVIALIFCLLVVIAPY